MRTLTVDLETYSETPIKTSGAYAYADDESFEVLLVGYAFDDEPVRVIDLTSPEADRSDWPALKAALVDPNVIKTAYNAAFERICLAKRTGLVLPPEQWRCTAVQAARLGYPPTLEKAGIVAKLDADEQKMAAGKSLIRYFCIPCIPTTRNGGRTRNLPRHDPEKWELFKEYCARDVEVERRLRKKLDDQTTVFEHRLWCLDQRINDRGVRVDKQLVESAIQIDAEFRQRLEREAINLTGVANPNAVAQLKNWLEYAVDTEITSLNKATVAKMIGDTDNETVRRVLEIRQELGKTSVSKYLAMDRAFNRDDRVRGLLQYYGANRTGRWAGRLVQVQNLPQNKLPDLDLARQLVRCGDKELLELIFGPPAFTLSQLIRTAFIPAENCRFIVADFSAIEARVIAWLAGEKWRMDVFNSHGKIYEASAAAMFNVPLESITKGSPLRQKGKVAELALGYQGAAGALKAMGALDMGLTEQELPGLVKAWRRANPKIVQLWYDTENAAFEAIQGHPATINRGIRLYWKNDGSMRIQLPSKREMVYQNARIENNKIIYDGIGQERKAWGPIETYGGKITENIIQAIARDCLAVAMVRLDEAGYKIVMHVHDEVILEVPNGTGSLDEVGSIMSRPIEWAPGLPLRADGYECDYYKKD